MSEHVGPESARGKDSGYKKWKCRCDDCKAAKQRSNARHRIRLSTDTVREKPLSQEEFLEEFEHTRARHGGCVEWAAPIFGVGVGAILQRINRAKAAGIRVRYTRLADLERSIERDVA